MFTSAEQQIESFSYRLVDDVVHRLDTLEGRMKLLATQGTESYFEKFQGHDIVYSGFGIPPLCSRVASGGLDVMKDFKREERVDDISFHWWGIFNGTKAPPSICLTGAQIKGQEALAFLEALGYCYSETFNKKWIVGSYGESCVVITIVNGWKGYLHYTRGLNPGVSINEVVRVFGSEIADIVHDKREAFDYAL